MEHIHRREKMIMRRPEHIDYDEMRAIAALNKAAMPDSMKGAEFEFRMRDRPNPQGTTKDRYIFAWLNWFDESSAHGWLDSGYSRTRPWLKITDSFYWPKKTVTAGFNWIADNFVELDLGENIKWFSASRNVMKLIHTGKWNNETEAHLRLKYIQTARWNDDAFNKEAAYVSDHDSVECFRFAPQVALKRFINPALRNAAKHKNSNALQRILKKRLQTLASAFMPPKSTPAKSIVAVETILNLNKALRRKGFCLSLTAKPLPKL